MPPTWRGSGSSKSVNAMRFKVDENLPHEVCDLLNRAGHDAISVGEQGLSGSDDARIYERCQDEERALITLDVGFANLHAYPG